MKRILVTGGAGFIGSAVVRHIINETRDAVVVVDKLTYAGNLMSLAPVAQNARFAFEQVDICDRLALDNVFQQYQPDCVMHLAAESHVDRSIDGLSLIHILAGAGSGKTRVFTNKIAHLIRVCGYQARHIAAVTFTNKAAREMKERVAQTLGRKEARGLMISTFHTLGLDIIKREFSALGMKSNFSLFDDTDQVALLLYLIHI